MEYNAVRVPEPLLVLFQIHYKGQWLQIYSECTLNIAEALASKPNILMIHLFTDSQKGI